MLCRSSGELKTREAPRFFLDSDRETAVDTPRRPRSMKSPDATRDDQSLLPMQQRQQQRQAVADGHHRGAPAGRGSFPWATVVVILLLTFNSVMAVYRSRGDRGTVAFVVFSYLDLMSLFFCLRRYESAEPGSQLRDRLKVAVWLLTTALTLVFSFKVAALMPPAVAVVLWLMAFGTIAGGFYTFFCSSDKQSL